MFDSEYITGKYYENASKRLENIIEEMQKNQESIRQELEKLRNECRNHFDSIEKELNNMSIEKTIANHVSDNTSFDISIAYSV